MATLRQVGLAEKLIHEIPRLNNRTQKHVKSLVAIRSQWQAMSQEDRDAVLALFTERGYDIAEYDAMLTAWEAVDAEMESVGITQKDQPR